MQVRMQIMVVYETEEKAKLSAQLEAAEAVKKALTQEAGFKHVALKSGVVTKA